MRFGARVGQGSDRIEHVSKMIHKYMLCFVLHRLDASHGVHSGMLDVCPYVRSYKPYLCL